VRHPKVCDDPYFLVDDYSLVRSKIYPRFNQNSVIADVMII
jgi:hypothetical protein